MSTLPHQVLLQRSRLITPCDPSSSSSSGGAHGLPQQVQLEGCSCFIVAAGVYTPIFTSEPASHVSKLLCSLVRPHLSLQPIMNSRNFPRVFPQVTRCIAGHCTMKLTLKLTMKHTMNLNTLHCWAMKLTMKFVTGSVPGCCGQLSRVLGQPMAAEASAGVSSTLSPAPEQPSCSTHNHCTEDKCDVQPYAIHWAS
jgi:hypothetical protein